MQGTPRILAGSIVIRSQSTAPSTDRRAFAAGALVRVRREERGSGRVLTAGSTLVSHRHGRLTMSVFQSSPTTPPVLRAELPLLNEAQLAAAASWPATTAAPGVLPGRSASVLPMGERRRSRPAGGDTSPHRAVPSLDGAPRTGPVHDRSASVNGLRLLPLRPHRRSDPSEPSPVRAPAEGPSVNATRHGPGRVGLVPLHRRTHFTDARRPRRAARLERAIARRP